MSEATPDNAGTHTTKREHAGTSTSVVLIDAARSAVIPDGADLPETPAGVAGDVIEALLDRASLDSSELTRLFVADPRYLSTGCSVSQAGWTLATPPLGLTTTVSARSAHSVARAVQTIEADPEAVVVVAASDFGAGAVGGADGAAHARRRQNAVRDVSTRWGVDTGDLTDWAHASYARSAECSAAGDFSAEIVSTKHTALTDRLQHRSPSDATSHPARGASAMILTGEDNAQRLGLRFRARLHAQCAVQDSADMGVAPLGTEVVDALLGSAGFGIGHLDQLEVPEQHAVTPIAWIKQTGISEYLVNPRGGDLGFGHLSRSGDLRSLITMLNSLEATGGDVGAVVASEGRKAVAFVLDVAASRPGGYGSATARQLEVAR